MKRFLSLMLCIIPLLGFAALLENIPSQVSQPDGTVLELLASGDEYANRLHDANGFTIIQSQTDGYYYYAVLMNGEPAASAWRVGSADPATKGIPANITISKAARDAKIKAMEVPQQRNSRGPNTGTVNNLNVFIRFSDQTEFALPREFYDARFNDMSEGAISLRDYFQKVSYNQLNYVTHHYPSCLPQESLSYQDSHPRSYYMPYNTITNPGGYNDSDERAVREQTMLMNAINAIASQVPSDLNIDADNDGNVDNVCFIIRGPHTAWADLLWAHRWALYVQEAFINGKQVWDFTFQPEDQNSVRTLCHEMFHSVGAPDLYHYTFNGVTPAGCWDIMESGNGHMSMYMKYAYGGWLSSIPSMTIGGTYTLNPATSPTNNVFKLAIPGSTSQYLVFEYRKRGSDIYEAELPGSGLIISRVNQNYQGNADGPPDELYIFRPNGSNTINGQIADAAFSADVWRTEFNAYTNPKAFLSNGNAFQVNINSISSAGETISFQVSDPNADLPPVISSISPVSGSILANTEFTVTVNASVPDGTITMVEFRLDDAPFATDTLAPFSTMIDGSSLEPGVHSITVTAHASTGLSTSRTSFVRIVNPMQQTWFSWLSDSPTYAEFGRGAVPIKVAIDMDLGTQEYLVKGLRYKVVADAWGQPAVPGLVNAKINRFASGLITEQTLMELGNILNPIYDQDFVLSVEDSTRISGQIAVILDLFEYQNVLFDINASCGHSWLTEPNRQWTDALARGMLGAAAIELLLVSPTVEGDDPNIPALQLKLSNHPNPFTRSTSIRYSLKDSAPVTISVYNLKGQKVCTLMNGIKSSGTHEISWNGRDDKGNKVGSGVYFTRMVSGTEALSAKMLLID